MGGLDERIQITKRLLGGKIVAHEPSASTSRQHIPKSVRSFATGTTVPDYAADGGSSASTLVTSMGVQPREGY